MLCKSSCSSRFFNLSSFITNKTYSRSIYIFIYFTSWVLIRKSSWSYFGLNPKGFLLLKCFLLIIKVINSFIVFWILLWWTVLLFRKSSCFSPWKFSFQIIIKSTFSLYFQTFSLLTNLIFLYFFFILFCFIYNIRKFCCHFITFKFYFLIDNFDA